MQPACPACGRRLCWAGTMRCASAPARPRRRFIPVSDQYVGNKFFRIENGVRKATPLLLVLAVVEISDVVFAVDSIPAVRRGLCTRSLGSSLGLSLAPGNAAV